MIVYKTNKERCGAAMETTDNIHKCTDATQTHCTSNKQARTPTPKQTNVSDIHGQCLFVQVLKCIHVTSKIP